MLTRQPQTLVQSEATTHRVAVVTTCFNQAEFLAEAIESVLAQSRPADQVILVDDGSVMGPRLLQRAMQMFNMFFKKTAD